MTKVLVTGGTGFIGSALVRHLLAANFEVRVLTRHKQNLYILNNLDVEVAKGDIICPESVNRAVKGCSVIFDLAALYVFYPFWEKKAKAMYKINTQGTVNLLNAALKYGVARFIHTSTIATINTTKNSDVLDENCGFDPVNASHYARSKFLAEQEVLKFYAMGVPAIILNPGVAFGERDYKPTPSGDVIVKFLNGRYPCYFDTTWAVADVDDIARAHISAITNGQIGERYILCHDKEYSLKTIFGLLENITGIKAPSIKIPYLFLNGFAYADELLSCTLLKKKPLMSTEGIKFCMLSRKYSNSKATKELGYVSTPFKATLTKAVDWYRHNSYIDPPGLFRFKKRGLPFVKRFMKKTKINRYTDKLNPGTLLFFYIIKLASLLRKTLLKKCFFEDGWRKVAYTYLRSEHSKFALTAFRINYLSDKTHDQPVSFKSAREHFITRLQNFLRNHPTTHWQIEWNRFCAYRVQKQLVDIMEVSFSDSGKIKTALFYPDPTASHLSNDDEINADMINRFIEAYNQTTYLSDKKRPLVLRKKLRKTLLKNPHIQNTLITHQVYSAISRILSAHFVNFEVLPEESSGADTDRFRSPIFIKSKHTGFGLLNILCRFVHNFAEADLWVQCSHIPIDGVPLQEVLDTLKREWGKTGVLYFPQPTKSNHFKPIVCSTKAKKKAIYQGHRLIDFQPFLNDRKMLNKSYQDARGISVTVATLLMWRLAHTPAFEDIKFAVPIDLKATSRRERTLGFVFVRPSIFFDTKKPDRGFVQFQREFNRQLRETRKRRSESYRLLESYSIFPPFVYAASRNAMPQVIGDFVGTIGLTIIKRADVFIGPFSDAHYDGFIAISNLFNPTQDAQKVCNVSIKCAQNKVESCLDAIEEIATTMEIR